MAERNRQRVRQSAQKEKNILCFDCQRHGPQSDVVLPMGIFACGRCAGLHRSIPGHRVLTIQAARWTNEDVEAVEAGGNRRARKRWLARYPQPGLPTYDANDDQQMERFIMAVWRDKLFFHHADAAPLAASPGGERKSAARGSSPGPAAIPLPLPPVNSLAFDSAFGSGATPSKGSGGPGISGSSTSSPSSAFVELDLMGTPQAAVTPAASTPAIDFDDSIFDAPGPVQASPPQTQASPPTAGSQDPAPLAGFEPIPQGSAADCMMEYMKRVLRAHSLTREEFLGVVEECLTRLRVPWQRGVADSGISHGRPAAPVQQQQQQQQQQQYQPHPFSYLSPQQPPAQQHPQLLLPQLHHQPGHPLDAFGGSPHTTSSGPAAVAFPGDLGDPFGGGGGGPAGLVDPFGNLSVAQPVSHSTTVSLVDSLSLSRPGADHGDDIFGGLMGHSGRPLTNPEPRQASPQSTRPTPAAGAKDQQQPSSVDHFSSLNPFI